MFPKSTAVASLIILGVGAGTPTAFADTLPAVRDNVRVIDKLPLTSTEDGVGDVHVFKGFAYVAAAGAECPSEGGSGAGVSVVNARRPGDLKKVAFIPAGDHDFVDEGLHTIHLENQFFVGDVLIMNHTACDPQGLEGVSLWDITRPRSPVPLAQHFGDFDFFGEPFANATSNVVGWTTDNGSRAYTAATDNSEKGSTDVDIFDITNPSAPVLIAETGFPDWPAAEADARAGETLATEVWFRRLDGAEVLAVSYWDAGWVFLDVEDPANPVFIYDTNYPNRDLLGFSPPEGNALQGEWSSNGRFFLGADEDDRPFRTRFDILTGALPGTFPADEFEWTVPVAKLFTEDKAEGTVVWGGSGCAEDTNGNGASDRKEVPSAGSYDAQYSPGEERILVLTRGRCFFADKVESAELNGWDAALVGNNHEGSAGGASPDSFVCGTKSQPYEPAIAGGCIGHQALHRAFSDTPYYGSEDYIGSDLPPIGSVGKEVRLEAQFDGWGYLNLYNYGTGAFRDAFATKPAVTRRFAFDYGPLSVHEVATDPRKGVNLAYAAWRAAGFVVVGFGGGEISQRGIFRTRTGNDFWGLSVIKQGKRRPLVAASDRDRALWIFTYTGRE